MERPQGKLTPSDASFDAAAPDTTRVAGTSGEVEQLKQEIHETQQELQQTVAAIQERLSPAHLKEQAANTVHDATIGRVHQMINRAEDRVNQAAESTRHAATEVSREVRNNPIPYVLIGAGVAWLFASRRQNRSGRNFESRQEWPRTGTRATTELSEDVAWGGSSMSEPASGSSGAGSYGGSELYGSPSYASTSYGSSPSDSASSRAYGSTLSRQARIDRLRSRWDDMLQDNPMALGVAALAAGALLGATIPATEVENEYLGEARDTVVESAKTLAENAAQKVVEQA
jgi:ElaB/YqjD/DUF883 family membrane-anchored ribosome-binding protein